MRIHLTPGILVAVEGIDGAGKTTQAERLADALNAVGLGVRRTKEPTGGPWGQKLRDSSTAGRMSPGEELQAFMHDRREHVDTVLRPALAAGEVVIVDRYYYSTAAYQGARGLDVDAIIAANEAFAPRPDLLVVLDVDAAVGVARIRERGDAANLFEREDDLRRAGLIFDQLQGPHVFHVAGHLPPEAITKAVLARLYGGPLFDRLCLKRAELDACEPVHCRYRLADACRYVDLGQLAPVDAGDLPERLEAIAKDPALDEAQRTQAVLALFGR